MALDIARRVSSEPLLRPRDVPSSSDAFEVVSVLNPAAARLGDGIHLLLRVAERPVRRDPPRDAVTVDLEGADPKLVPLGQGYHADDVVPIAMFNAEERRMNVAYLPKDLPGLDLSDPRGVTFIHPTTKRQHIFLTQFSHLRCARSEDGQRFEVDAEPSIFPDNPLEEYGCEDARASCIDGIWYITYVSVSRIGITTSLATTRDFREFRRRGVILPPDQKDVVLFPARMRGHFVALTRPMPSSFGHVLGIWIAMPDGDYLPWGRHEPIVLPRTGRWDERQTGAGTVPFRVREGWLAIYHGANAEHHYQLGAVLLDADDPSKVLARSPEPILEPELPFEVQGFFGNVVYACGHVPLDDEGRRIRVYYGAADSCVAAADFSVDEIIASLETT